MKDIILFSLLIVFQATVLISCSEEKQNQETSLNNVEAENVAAPEAMEENFDEVNNLLDQNFKDNEQTKKSADEINENINDEKEEAKRKQHEKDSLKIVERQKEQQAKKEKQKQQQLANSQQNPPKRQHRSRPVNRAAAKTQNPKQLEQEPSPKKKKSLKKSLSNQGNQQIYVSNQKSLYKGIIERNTSFNPRDRNQISIKLKESMTFNGITLPKYTIISGYTSLNGDRLMIKFTNTIYDGQIVDISNIDIYDVDKIKGLKVFLKQVKNNQALVKTGSKIASRLSSEYLGTNDNIRDVSEDAQSFSKDIIYQNVTIEKNRQIILSIKP